MDGYTVLDVETTGLSPSHHHKIVELAVVYVSLDGVIQDRWSTLINPQRDVGPTRIHGITATDVIGAPTFAEVAPYVLRAIAGRVMVAHNAPFDLRFIAHELEQAGVPLVDLPLTGVCTMQWSKQYLQASSRRLIDCCQASGISLENAHSAAADAYATAKLLAHYLERARFRPLWHDAIRHAQSYRWPLYRGPYHELRMARRGETHAPRPTQWLDTIVSRMPRAAEPAVEAYLGVLEMALLDGLLTESEKAALVTVAREAGLSRGRVLDIHCEYLGSLARVALADGVVTAQERADLDLVARLLGLPSSDVDAALKNARGVDVPEPSGEAVARTDVQLNPGDRIALTGDMALDRKNWEARARVAGLVPGDVTKTTKVLVASDPNSLSGKAAKARRYGIPIIDEAQFAQVLDSYLAGRGRADLANGSSAAQPTFYMANA
ncbi:MAG: exonuclease domain-containing protein [Friedmanniella sp.]